MFTLLKVLFALAIVVPLVLVAALLGGVMLAVVIGIAFFLVKVALFLVLPVLAVIWLCSKLFGVNDGVRSLISSGLSRFTAEPARN